MKKTTSLLRFGFIFSLGVSTVFSYPFTTDAQESKSQSMLQPIAPHVDVIAHRGASGYAPEHTVAAYKKAIQMKADYVELDLQMTKDGHLVVLHDTSLARTTNVEQVFPNRSSWLVKDFTLEEIKRLDAGSWFNEKYPALATKENVGQHILTVEEALAFIKKQGHGKAGIYIETKAPNEYPGMEEKLVHSLRDAGLISTKNVILQSFSKESLEKLNTMVPDIPLIQLYSQKALAGKNLDAVFDEAAKYADGVGPDYKLVTPQFMQDAHERKLLVHPWTVNEQSDMVSQLSLGVDGMFTNYTDKAVDLLKKPHISHGVASGEVTSSSAVLWARASRPSEIKFEIAADPSFTHKMVKTEKSQEVNDNTVQVNLQGLQPDTTYYYTAQALPGTYVEKGSFKTAPAANTEKSTTLVWGGDTGGQGNIPPFKSFSAMADIKPDFFLFNGDTIYADNATPAVPNPPSKTIEDFRAKYKENRTDPYLRKLLSSTSTYAVWDDHEVTNDFSGPSEPLTPIGFKAFSEYWPIAKARSSSDKLYHKFSWGNTVDLIILNNRSYRDPNTKPDGADKTMLGKEQLEWLKKELASSDARVKLVASSVPISIATGKQYNRDGWANGDHENPNDRTGYEREFGEISNFIKENGIKNVNFVTTDVHFSDILQYDPDKDGKVDYNEFVSGPIGAVKVKPKQPDPTFGPTSLYANGDVFNFGVLKIDPSNDKMTVEIRDENGNALFQKTFPLQK